VRALRPVIVGISWLEWGTGAEHTPCPLDDPGLDKGGEKDDVRPLEMRGWERSSRHSVCAYPWLYSH
jgi:hypothetical protein